MHDDLDASVGPGASVGGDRAAWALMVVVLLGLVALYARTFDYGFTAWDDTGHVSNDPLLGPLGPEQVRV